MSNFGVLSFKGTGHLNPLIALSRELIAHGHKVTFIHKPEMEARVRERGIDFCSVGHSGPRPFREELVGKKQKPSGGIAAIQYGLKRIGEEIEMFLREGPAAITQAGIEVLIIDEIALAGPTLAEMLRLPYFILSTSVPHHFGWDAPSLGIEPRSWTDSLQRAILEVSVLQMRGPVRQMLDKIRRKYGLGSIRNIKRVFPELAHITPLPQCLDLPRANLPENFYYTGPFVDETARQRVEFPWQLLDGRRLVYASLGTTLKGEPDTFRMIAEACDGLDLQLVISLGDRRDPEMFRNLPGTPLVVRNTPQLELLKRADAVITHAGSNTAFEALMQGKPMVALPKAFDQPAIAARLQRAGVAEVLLRKNLNAFQIRTALTEVVNDPSYRIAAKTLQAKILSTRGLDQAVDIIERALNVGSRGPIDS
jgi:zeaxanthin glucosyltransferase